VRLALIGLGYATHDFHLPALRRLEDATLAGGVDVSPERRAAFERATGTPAFETLDQLLGRARPEVAVVATPPDSHAELCTAAVGAGMHVICEKPFAATLQEADAVLASAAAAGRRVAVNHELRHWAIFRAVAERIGTAEVGRPAFCQITQEVDLEPWRDPVPWRAALAERTLLEAGVHLVDLMLVLFGGPPTAVYARHSRGWERERQGDAVHLVTLEFPEERLGQITIDRLVRGGTRYAELRADCERASLRASIGGRASVRVGKRFAERAGLRVDLAGAGMAWMERGVRRTVLARPPRDAGVRATAELLRGALAAFAAGREPPSSGAEARTVLAVIDAAYRSAIAGRRIELDLSTAIAP
jgi:predicted dehydrogenase